jgi:signal transduction histidine kinase
LSQLNLYSKKQRWKILLFIIALIIVGLTIWYASYITQKVSNAEKQRVNNWGETIRKKAELVMVANASFKKIAENEKRYVETWVGAMMEMQKDLSDYSFPLIIIQSNQLDPKSKNIPLILTENDNFSSSSNLNEDQNHPDSIAKFIKEWSELKKPIEIKYANDKSQKIYYRNSDDYYNLQFKSDSLIDAFNRDLVQNKDLVPVLLIDSETQEVIATNLDTNLINTPEKLQIELEAMQLENTPIQINLEENKKGILYYRESTTLTQLRYFPYVILSIITVFAFISYLLFSTFRRAEQNQVWVGMAKETAHQLGTPLSSLMAWIELLKAEGVSQSYLSEMAKDLQRLETVTDRFSKIGSENKLYVGNIVEEVHHNISYLKNRVSGKVTIETESTEQTLNSNINASLFGWVIENIVKNAVDAMEGNGNINIYLFEDKNMNIIEIQDTGKGIPNQMMKNVFEPGYTTKKRGWGLGLSLAKRIVEEHHKGKIFVKSSELGIGTTFRIELPKV